MSYSISFRLLVNIIFDILIFPKLILITKLLYIFPTYIVVTSLLLMILLWTFYDSKSQIKVRLLHTRGKKWQQKASILLIVDGHSVTHIKWVKVWQEIVDGTKTSHSKDIASEDLTVVCHHKMCSLVSYPMGDEPSL